jgi:hypothetical protein
MPSAAEPDLPSAHRTPDANGSTSALRSQPLYMPAATSCRSPRQPQPAAPYASSLVPSNAPLGSSFIVPNWYRKDRAFQDVLPCRMYPALSLSGKSAESLVDQSLVPICLSASRHGDWNLVTCHQSGVRGRSRSLRRFVGTDLSKPSENRTCTDVASSRCPERENSSPWVRTGFRKRGPHTLVL